MKLLDLFSGIGGFSLAAQWVWKNELEIVGFCEIDSYCQKVLNKNFPNTPIYGDITKLDGTQFKDIDLITGGFPCQDISIAGKGEGITGQRSGLWSEMHRLIGEVRPRFALIENVPMLIHRGLGRVLSDLAEIGYDAEWQIISAKDMGAPHLRKRIWIVGYANGTNEQQIGEVQKGKKSQSNRIDGNASNTEGRQSREQAEQERWESVSGGDKKSPDSQSAGLQRKPIKEMEESGKPTKRNRKFANTNSKRLQGIVESNGDKGKKVRYQQIVRHDRTWQENWYEVATEFCRVDDGVSSTLYETIKDYGYEDADYKEAITEIDNIRREILREMWCDQCEVESTPHKEKSRSSDDIMHKMSYQKTHDKWKLGERIKNEPDLRDMWKNICSIGFSQTQVLQSRMLERIREIECNEKVASSRTDRLKGLGNAIVPQVAEIIMSRIKKIDDKHFAT